MLLLFETAAGLALFKVLNGGKLKETEDVGADFATLEQAQKVWGAAAAAAWRGEGGSRAACGAGGHAWRTPCTSPCPPQMVRLKAFSKFENTTEALAAATALVESKLSKRECAEMQAPASSRLAPATPRRMMPCPACRSAAQVPEEELRGRGAGGAGQEAWRARAGEAGHYVRVQVRGPWAHRMRPHACVRACCARTTAALRRARTTRACEAGRTRARARRRSCPPQQLRARADARHQEPAAGAHQVGWAQRAACNRTSAHAQPPCAPATRTS